MMGKQQIAQLQKEQLFEHGLSLARKAPYKDFKLYEGVDSRGRRESVTFAQLHEGLERTPDWVVAQTMIMCENLHNYMGTMNETVRALNFGKFQKYAFPLVRAVWPNLIAHELVSVQPMQGPTGLVFYMKFIYGLSKGNVVAGQDVIENPNYEYSSENVTGEIVGAAGAANQTGRVMFYPVRPGTFRATDGTQIVTDDGNGAIIGDIGVGTNTIDYRTGAFDFDFTAAPTVQPTANYVYRMEANDNLPELELTIESSTVEPRESKLRAQWSVEASHDLMVVYGEDLETQLVGALGQELKFEIDRRIIQRLRQIARATEVAAPGIVGGQRVWPGKPPSGVDFPTHKLTLLDYVMIPSSNDILKATQRGRGQWAVIGIDVANIIESLPGFESYNTKIEGRGVWKLGKLNNRWDIFLDTYNEADGTSIDEQLLIGYNGTQMFDTGFVFAPYVPFYTTPTIHSPNAEFVMKKGIASRYAMKEIDSRFYANARIDRTLTP